MNNTEFNDWLARFGGTFTSWRGWLEGLVDEDRQTFLRNARRAFQDVEAIDANEVTDRIVRGDDEMIGNFDRDKTAAHIRRLAKQNKQRRDVAAERRTPQVLVSHEKVDNTQLVGKLFRQVEAAIAAGENIYEACKRLFPPADDRRGPRFSCHRCQDSGFVNIWSPYSMLAVVNGEELAGTNLRTCSTICDCDKGTEKISPKDKKQVWTESHVYNPTKHCLCPFGDVRNPERIKELRAFVSLLQERQLESMDNYEPAFAEWNQGA